MNKTYFYQFPNDGYLGCSFAVANKAVMNNLVHMSFHTCVISEDKILEVES